MLFLPSELYQTLGDKLTPVVCSVMFTFSVVCCLFFFLPPKVSFSTEILPVSPVLLRNVRSCMQATFWIYDFAGSWLTVTLNDSISLNFSELLRSPYVNAQWPLSIVTPAVNFPAILRLSRTSVPHEFWRKLLWFFFLLDDLQMCYLPYMHWRPYNKSSNPLTGSVYTCWTNFVSNSTQWGTEHVTICGVNLLSRILILCSGCRMLHVWRTLDFWSINFPRVRNRQENGDRLNL